jgi:hypothetical protein
MLVPITTAHAIARVSLCARKVFQLGSNVKATMTIAILASSFMHVVFYCQLGIEAGVLHCHKFLGISTTARC